MSKEFNISQSLMKELFAYKNQGTCGLQFEAKFIDGKFDLFRASDAMSIGTWFEYELTGSLPKGKAIPLPKLTQKGELTEPYKRMKSHINNFKRTFAFYGIEILEVGTKVIVDGLEGTLDLLCKATHDIEQDGRMLVKAGQRFIVDIKTTGLLDDKWNDYGWNLDMLSNKTKLILQPIHYKYICNLKYGEDMPFWFILFHTNDENDFRIIDFRITEEHIEEHKRFIIFTVKWLKYYLETGFEARPEVKRCAECPLRVGCKSFAAVPKITVYELDSQKQ